jgi:hypothetical protein
VLSTLPGLAPKAPALPGAKPTTTTSNAPTGTVAEKPTTATTTDNDDTCYTYSKTRTPRRET